MSDVPETLEKELRVSVEKFGAEPYALAFRILRHYLGESWTSAKVKLGDSVDPFMLNERDEESGNRWTHLFRVQSLASHIFALRNTPSFGLLAERLNSRPTKPCYYEAQIASSYVESGFEIEIRRESQKRGKDFDFAARIGASTSINVEVTAKEDGEPSVNTLRNTLFAKRDQVPSDAPAILYVVVPESWIATGRVFADAVQSAASDFFARSKRFNAVVFEWDEAHQYRDGKIMVTAFRPFFNANARHTGLDLSFLNKPDPNFLDVDGFRRAVADNPERIESMIAKHKKPYQPNYVLWCMERGFLTAEILDAFHSGYAGSTGTGSAG